MLFQPRRLTLTIMAVTSHHQNVATSSIIPNAILNQSPQRRKADTKLKNKPLKNLSIFCESVIRQSCRGRKINGAVKKQNFRKANLVTKEESVSNRDSIHVVALLEYHLQPTTPPPRGRTPCWALATTTARKGWRIEGHPSF